MAKMIPSLPYPDCKSPGELEIFRRLASEPGTDAWTVLHSLCIADHRRQQAGEADFVVLMPERGVLCVEVKACQSLKLQNGDWYYGATEHPDRRGPFRQAAEAMWSVRDWLTRNRPDLVRVPFWSAVIFPYCELRSVSPEWHTWQLVDKRTFNQPLAPQLRSVLDRARERLSSTPSAGWFRESEKLPTIEQCNSIAALLRPKYEFFESPKARAKRLEDELRRYTESQLAILDALDQNPRLVIEGPAGTGKTLLAIEAARRCAASIPGDGKASSPPRVLLTCFNALLGAWLRDQVEPLAGSIQVKTFGRHLLDVAGLKAPPPNATQDFWKTRLPELALDRLTSLSGQQQAYDAVIVDEAQDLLDGPMLDVLDLSLKGGINGGVWRAFGDFERQAIYERRPDVLEAGLARLKAAGATGKLRDNCRNTPRVANLVHVLAGLSPQYKRVLRPDDGRDCAPVFYSSEEQQKALLARALERLTSDGVADDEIIVLSTKDEQGCIASKMDLAPWRSRLTPSSKGRAGGIRFSTIHAFKGMEARAVVLTDIDDILSPKAQALFYVGITRTQEHLHILAAEPVRDQMLSVLVSGAPQGNNKTGAKKP